MTAMDSSPDGNVLLTGHPDHLLRLWDTRQEGVAASAAGTKRLKSHSEWVSAVSCTDDGTEPGIKFQTEGLHWGTLNFSPGALGSTFSLGEVPEH